MKADMRSGTVSGVTVGPVGAGNLDLTKLMKEARGERQTEEIKRSKVSDNH